MEILLLFYYLQGDRRNKDVLDIVVEYKLLDNILIKSVTDT